MEYETKWNLTADLRSYTHDEDPSTPYTTVMKCRMYYVKQL
jgi:hypothetical protein